MVMDELESSIENILFNVLELEYGCCGEDGPYIEGRDEAARQIRGLFSTDYRDLEREELINNIFGHIVDWPLPHDAKGFIRAILFGLDIELNHIEMSKKDSE